MTEAAVEAGDADADRPALLVRLTCIVVSEPIGKKNWYFKGGACVAV